MENTPTPEWTTPVPAAQPTRIDGFKSDFPDKFAAEYRQVNQIWPLTQDQLKEFATKNDEEAAALRELADLELQIHEISKRKSAIADRASKAKKSREDLCLSFERTFNIPPGTRWIIDYENCVIAKK